MRFSLALLALAVVIPGAVLALAIAPLSAVASFFFLGVSGIQARNLHRIVVKKDYSLITGFDDKPLGRPESAAKWWIVADSLVITGGILAFAVYWLSGSFRGAMAVFFMFFLLPALLLRVIIGAKFRARSV